MTTSDIRRVAVIGTGVIGASWAAIFLARGLDVVAFDPAPGAESALRQAIIGLWPTMQAFGLAEDAAPDRLSFRTSVSDAVRDAQFVQENGPERLDFKRGLFKEMDAAAPADAVLASDPSRVLLGHPFNPPHLIPLIEVAGGKQTSEAAIATAMAFYAACGKHPIRLRKEVRGHVANRLQAALWQEAFHLVHSGVASVADIDAAIAHGPGLRWALLGPFLNLHLSGGAGGMRHTLAHLGPPSEAMWRDLGKVSLTPDGNEAIIAGVDAELAGRDLPEMIRQRDRLLVDLLRAKAAAGLP
jgi:3-hydroxyacyl-CoA dehydrogenase